MIVCWIVNVKGIAMGDLPKKALLVGKHISVDEKDANGMIRTHRQIFKQIKMECITFLYTKQHF